jgi:hypothetical protein
MSDSLFRASKWSQDQVSSTNNIGTRGETYQKAGSGASERAPGVVVRGAAAHVLPLGWCSSRLCSGGWTRRVGCCAAWGVQGARPMACTCCSCSWRIRRAGRITKGRTARATDAGRDSARRRGGPRARCGALCLRRLRTRAAPHLVAPQWLRGLLPPSPSALAYDKALCASLDGITLHAATLAGTHHAAAREALLRYVLRPPIAKESVEP